MKKNPKFKRAWDFLYNLFIDGTKIKEHHLKKLLKKLANEDGIIFVYGKGKRKTSIQNLLKNYLLGVDSEYVV